MSLTEMEIVSLNLAEACMVIESMLMDEEISKIKSLATTDAKRFLKTMDDYFQIDESLRLKFDE